MENEQVKSRARTGEDELAHADGGAAVDVDHLLCVFLVQLVQILRRTTQRRSGAGWPTTVCRQVSVTGLSPKVTLLRSAQAETARGSGLL